VDGPSRTDPHGVGRLFEETIRLGDEYIRYCLPSPIVG